MSKKSIEELRQEKHVLVEEALDEQTRMMAKRINDMNKRIPWLKRINLQWKLILAFIGVTAIATLAGWLSINYIGRVADQYDAAIKSYGFAQGDVGHAMIMASESRRVVRDMVYFDDEERAAGYQTEFAKLKEYYGIYETLVKENLVGEVEENAFAVAHQKYDVYIAMASDIMAQAANASARQRDQLMVIVGRLRLTSIIPLMKP